MISFKNKRKISLKTIILLICSFIMTTFAWFTYTKIVEPVLSIHMASWNIKYFIGEEEQKNADQGIEIPISSLYPGMEEQQVIVDIYNHGEVLVDIEHEIKEIIILGTKYELVPEGGTPTKENYVTLLEPEIIKDETTGELMYKGPILYEPEKFPFTIELEHTTQIKPEIRDEEGKKIPGQGYLRVKVNWIGENDELDTEWGYKAGEYFTNNPEATSAMSIVVSVDSYQSANPGSIAQIALDKTTAEIRNGEEIPIVATLNAGAKENLVWESSDESIATVTRSEENLSTATITGIKGGNVKITAKSPDGTVKATCVVTVIQYISNITLDKENAEVAPGGSVELTATVDEGSVDKLYWESSETSIATIEVLEEVTETTNASRIKVNGLKAGIVTITARNEDGTVKATCEVTVITTLADITTNDDIGEYIDLGLSLVGTNKTTDDWRILWVDEEGQFGDSGNIYVMLNDYLPNNVNGKNYAQLAGLNTPSTYSVNSTKNRDDLVTKLRSNWEALATDLEIEGATVIGAPTADLLQLSYNYKSTTDIVYTDHPRITGDVWVRTTKGNTIGYWLASANESYAYNVWDVENGGYLGTSGYSHPQMGVCPVVCLPANTNAEIVDGIWTIIK